MTERLSETGLLAEYSAVRSLELGDVRLTYVLDAAVGLIPARFFPDVPAEYWSSRPEFSTCGGRVAVPAGGLMVERDGRVLMIDAGLGTLTGQTTFGFANSGASPDTIAALAR